MNQILMKNIYALRKKKDIRVSDLSKITGIDEDKLTKIECGLEEASFDEIKKLSEFYRVEVPDLMNELLVSESDKKSTQTAQGCQPKYQKPSKGKNIAVIILSAILLINVVSIWDIVDSSILLSKANFTYGGYAKASAVIRLVTGILELISSAILFVCCLFLPLAAAILFFIIFAIMLTKAIIKIVAFKQVKPIQ